ncbi:MAG: substrate-binding domain-containing protein [Phycisphaerales bacterium]|nr:substrate-binding domain-containing protein [Phycisphaerales bacterium]
MSRAKWCVSVVLAVGAALLAGCGGGKKDEPKKPAPSPGGTPASYTIGVIAKSTSNKIFLPVEKGAKDAAAALSAELGIEVSVIWQTPPNEDAKLQSEYITNLASQCDGIAISVSDANMLTQAIDGVVAKGVQVVTFDSDAPDSARFAYFGIDNYEAGRRLMDELATSMNREGVVAVLTGSRKPPNLEARVKGVEDAIAAYPDMRLLRVFDNESEDSKRAVEVLEQAQGANPEITGWAMVGGWALYTDNALDKIKGKAKVASLDAMPPQLPYLERREVELLLGQDPYEWGYKSVELLVARLHSDESPADPVVKAELRKVTPDNLAEYREMIKAWGMD